MFSKSFVTLAGFEVARTESRGINIQNGCTDLVIARNHVSFANSYGIQTVNGQRIVIDGNVVSDCSFHGIGLTAGASGCTIRENESFRNIDPAILRAHGIHLFDAPGNTLFGNRVHDNQDTGMQFSGGSNDCVAWNNRSWNNGDHGYDHVGSTGVSHTNDVAAGNYRDGFLFEAFSPGGSLFNSIAVNNGVTSNEFNLWVRSPAIDAGDSGVPNWPVTDAAGGARYDHLATPNTGAGPVTFSDIGALEFVPRVDAAPVVSCPSMTKSAPGSTVTFSVTVSDPDGEPITSLVMVPKKLPANSGATFVVNATNTGGTFTWPTGSFSGNFQVEFVASSALSGKRHSNIQIKAKGRHPASTS